jgi:hypothetical protein
MFIDMHAEHEKMMKMMSSHSGEGVLVVCWKEEFVIL